MDKPNLIGMFLYKLNKLRMIELLINKSMIYESMIYKYLYLERHVRCAL